MGYIVYTIPVNTSLPALPDADIWVGSVANVATPQSPSGDVTMNDTGAFRVTGFFSRPLSGPGTAANQVYIYNGANWVPTVISLPVNAYVQGGNAFGAVAIVGTTDNQDLQIITNNVLALLIAKTGIATFQFAANFIGNILKINNVATSWPAAQGAASTVLKNDGAGNLSWVVPSTLITAFMQGGNAFGATALLGTSDNNQVRIIANAAVGSGFNADSSVFLGNPNPPAVKVNDLLAGNFLCMLSGNAALLGNSPTLMIGSGGSGTRGGFFIQGTYNNSNQVTFYTNPFFSSNISFQVSNNGGGTNIEVMNFRASDQAVKIPLGIKLVIPSGANSRQGIATLTAGTVTILTSKVTANSEVYVTYNTPAGTLASGLSVPSAGITAGISFTINSLTTAGVVNTLDTSTVNWVIIDNA